MKTRIVKLMAVTMSVALMSTSCATIFNGSKNDVKFDTSPSQASITITNKKGDVVYQGQTPTEVSLKTSSGFFGKEQYKIKYSKDGYQDRIVVLDSRVSGWYWGNILLGGVIGMLIVDPATGSMYSLKSEMETEQLVPSGGSTAQEMKIINYNDIDEEMKASLYRIY